MGILVEAVKASYEVTSRIAKGGLMGGYKSAKVAAAVVKNTAKAAKRLCESVS